MLREIELCLVYYATGSFNLPMFSFFYILIFLALFLYLCVVVKKSMSSSQRQKIWKVKFLNLSLLYHHSFKIKVQSH